MKTKFNSVLIIGMGLIGSSISRALTENRVANNVYGLDSNDKVIKKLLSIDLNKTSPIEALIKLNEIIDDIK